MIISVTEEHISKGCRGDAFGCPLVLAFHASGFPDVMVSPDHVDFYYTDGELAGALPLPDIAQQFQNDFDSGIPRSPFSFEIPGLTSDLRSLASAFTPVAVV